MMGKVQFEAGDCSLKAMQLAVAAGNLRFDLF
jgi:hypothetical protein